MARISQTPIFHQGRLPSASRTAGFYEWGQEVDSLWMKMHSFLTMLSLAWQRVRWRVGDDGSVGPSQRKLLEVVYSALENGRETWDSIAGSRTGVYIGNFALDHLLIQLRDWASPKPYAATGADTSILANRISYIFNLHGPRWIE